jgi:colanic acid biosynthesis protein WcaH
MIINNDLYRQIVQVMPIPCVDIIVVDKDGQVLLARRTNEPAKGEWWFPGGRVHYLETRLAAATRKLREECGLEASNFFELGVFDVIVERSDNGDKLHAITSLFVAEVRGNTSFVLDAQNSEAEWCMPLDWLKLKLNPFIKQALTVFTRYNKEFNGQPRDFTEKRYLNYKEKS